MNIAKISPKGQITVPTEIRKKLGVSAGEQVIFLEKNGEIIIENMKNVKITVEINKNNEDPGKPEATDVIEESEE